MFFELCKDGFEGFDHSFKTRPRAGRFCSVKCRCPWGLLFFFSACVLGSGEHKAPLTLTLYIDMLSLETLS